MKPDHIILFMAAAALVACLFLWLMARAAKRKNDAEVAERAAAALRKPGMVRLSRRALEDINKRRLIMNRLPLSPAGFQRAIWDAPKGQRSTSSSDWILYFLLYQSVNTDHAAPSPDVGSGVTIDPGGGSFGGGGASGYWDTPAASVQATDAGLALAAGGVIGAGAAMASGGPTGEPAVDLDHYADQAAQEAGSTTLAERAAAAPEPAPMYPTDPVDTSGRESYGSGYSAPDPTPAPSPSYDSGSSSSSYDSGSSSSGGDSGGGGSSGGGD